MFTNNEVKPTKVYKVVFEHIKTGEQSSVMVEGTSSYEAAESVIGTLGDGYDLIMCIKANPGELN